MSLTTTLDLRSQGREGAAHGAVEVWLWAIAALVFAMIVVGGATRLTDSGLSITEWKPILGAIPPLSHDDWLVAFEKYKQIPEYHLVNKGMSLGEFQFIFWWEWAHRLLGRLIGVAFALPLVAFWSLGWLRRGTGPRFLAVLALGGLQGAIGWYMVSSGLAERVDVSQYRLALHLTTAFIIFGLLVWMALEERVARVYPASVASSDSPLPIAGMGAGMGKEITSGAVLAASIVGLVLLQVVLGAFVAGLKAGLVYNTWPLMNGEVIPHGIATLEPWYLNLFENHATVQFNHRLVAYFVVAVVAANAVVVARDPKVRAIVKRSAFVLLALVIAQAAFGIWTLLAGVPLWLGLVHQGGAAIVLAAAVWHLHARVRTP